jgi:16S rRNA processing protein RimM
MTVELGPDEVVVARIGRPHGVRGEVSVELRTDEPERRFADGAVLDVRPPAGRPPTSDPSRLTVVGSRTHQDRLLVTFAEIDDRGAAERLRGALLVTRVSGEVPEDPEEFYDHQLVGLAVVTVDGTPSGTVAEVVHTGAQDLLVVRREGREDALVPFVSALVPEVDLSAGRVVVADRPGLLEPLPDEPAEQLRSGPAEG